MAKAKEKASKRRSKAKKNPALISAKELGYFYEDGIRDFNGSALVGQDLSGMDLRDASFRNANLYGANLSDTDIRGANFDGADLGDANFDGSVMDDRTTYHGANVEGIVTPPDYYYGDDKFDSSKKMIVEKDEPLIGDRKVGDVIDRLRALLLIDGWNPERTIVLSYKDFYEKTGQSPSYPIYVVIRDDDTVDKALDAYDHDRLSGQLEEIGLDFRALDDVPGVSGLVAKFVPALHYDRQWWHEYFETFRQVIELRRSPITNPGKRKAVKKSKTPEWKRLLNRSQKLWETYDAKPLKKHLLAFGKHIEKLKASTSAKVKTEARNATRAFNAELKAHGWSKPVANPKKKAAKKKAPKKNPRLGFSGLIDLPVGATPKEVAEILDQDEIIAREVGEKGYSVISIAGTKAHHDMLLDGEVPGWKMWEHTFLFQPVHGWPEERSHYRIAPDAEGNPKKKGAKRKASKRRAGARKNTFDRLTAKHRREVNADLVDGGFDGNGRWGTMGAALNEVWGILAKHGIEQGEVMSADLFRGDKGHITLRMAFTNKDDAYAPAWIQNSQLAWQWHWHTPDLLEVVAYAS